MDRSVLASLVKAAVILMILVIPLAQIALGPISHVYAAGSWNPKVPCTPTNVRISDITNNKTGTNSFSSSHWTPGITTTVSGGVAKRWLTPGSTPSGWHSPGPSCSFFVEIDGVKRPSTTSEDSSSSYDATNGGGSYGGGSKSDFTFNAFDPKIVSNYGNSCTSSNDPTCYGRIHMEMDHDWQAAGYCGSGTTCDPSAFSSQTTDGVTLIDFQGFVYWDAPACCSAQDHSFSGWELHPLTAWRVHQAGPTPSFTYSPTSPSAGQTVTFTGSASGGTSPYTFAWTFGDGATGTGSTVTHAYSTSGSFTASLTVTDSKSLTGSTSKLVTVSAPINDFNISSSPSSLTIQSGTSGTSVVSLSSINGFSGTVSLSTSVTPSGLSASVSPTSVSVSSGGTGSSTLTVSSSTTGTYTVKVTGTSGSLSHTTTVTVSVVVTPDFTIASGSTSLTFQSGSSGTSTINLASLNGFSGTISLTSSVTPLGLTSLLNPTSVAVSSGGSVSSTLSVSSSTPGSYTVTITGTSGSLTHSTSLTVSVTALTSVVVGSDSAVGPSSLATGGSEKLIQDSAGKMIAVYADSTGRISLSYANADPLTGGWSVPAKSATPVSVYLRPTAVLLSLTSLRIIVEGGAAAGQITDIPVTVQRDSQNNINGFIFGSPTILDLSGAAAYPAAVTSHNGDILLVWAFKTATTSQIRSLRWDPVTGWTNFAGTSSTPDNVAVDNSTLDWMLPSIIERPDNNNVYMMANRLTNAHMLAFNIATWSGTAWTWGVQNLTYEATPSTGIEDPVTFAWDPVASVVVASYGITGTQSFGVFTLNSANVKTHLDTPSLSITERDWGAISVHVTTGDYYLFLMNVNTDGGSGTLGYIRHPVGGSWDSAMTIIDSSTTNEGLNIRPTGSSSTLDLLYAQGSSSPATIRFTRLSPFNPPSFSISASPTTLTLQAGSSVTSTLTLTSLYSFTGVATLSTSVSPSGATASPNPATVSLTSGGTGTSVLTISSLTIGNYTITVTATSGSITRTVGVSVRVVDFSIQASPTTTNIIVGQSGSSTITVKSLGGFSGPIGLTSTVSPSGLSTSFNPASITLTAGGSGISTLTVTSSVGGTYVVTVTGTSNGVSHTVQVTVNVADFSLSANPPTVTFQLGSNGSSTITASSLGGFSGTVGISTSVNPSTGLVVSCIPASLPVPAGSSAGSTCSLSASTGGTYTVTITGVSGSLTHTTTVTVRVGDFSLSANPTTVSVSTGSSGTSTLNIASLNSFTGTVSLSSSVIPSSGLAVSVNPASVTLSSGGSATSTITFSSTTVGSYNVTVTGTSGTLVHSVTILVTVTLAPDFTVTASPSFLAVQSGSSATSTINLASLNGFSGTVTLSTAVAPTTGLTASLNPTGVILTSGGSGSATLTLSSSTPGNYTVTITGTSGSLTHSVQVIVQVVDFTISANPSSLTTPPGTTVNSTITLSSVNGLSGSVSLTAAVSPSGPTISLNPTSVLLTSGGSGTSTMIFSSTSGLTPGTYTITISATVGSLSHNVVVTVNVPDFSLTSNPSTVNMLVGTTGSSTLSLTSLGGFTGTITLTASSSSGSLTASLSSSSIALSSGGSGSSTLNLSSSTIGTYTVTITGTSGSTSHTVTITVNVQDFTLTTNTSSLSLSAGGTGTVTINLSSINGFTGTVSLSAVCTPTGTQAPTLSLSSSSVSLSSGSGTSTLTIKTKHRTAPGTYTITITGTSGGVTHTSTVTLTVT